MAGNTYRIAILFNANKVYDRNIIEGIGEYIQRSNNNWDIYIEESYITDKQMVKSWQGDGIIADFDDQELIEILKARDIPIIGVGSSYENENDYPDGYYIGTDNYSVISDAFNHIGGKGIENFAFYGLPDVKNKKWAIERENAFRRIISGKGYTCSIYRGYETNSRTWQYSMNRLQEWLQMLPKPVGIIAVTDSRARHLLQVCESASIIVPDEVSIIGIDNERIAQHLTRTSLSSVNQSSKKMGYEAGRMLESALSGKQIKNKRIIIPAHKVYSRQSSDFRAIRDPYVIRAMHYIRMNANNGIKAYHVLDELRMSRSNLEARFKNEIGSTIHNEIHKERLSFTCSLLGNQHLPMIELYKECGYPSLQYMYSVFSKSMGMTPKEYRDKVNENNEAV